MDDVFYHFLGTFQSPGRGRRSKQQQEEVVMKEFFPL